MSEQIIICGTTGSKSKNSRRQILSPVMQLFSQRAFGTCELFVGPANHPKRTPEKHYMALSQASYIAQTKEKVVSLIFVIPDDHTPSHLSEIQSLAETQGISMRILALEEVITGKLME